MSLLELFCSIDDFWQVYEPIWHQTLLQSGQRCRRRASCMSMSEMMTIVVHFHQKRYRDFKTYYRQTANDLVRVVSIGSARINISIQDGFQNLFQHQAFCFVWMRIRQVRELQKKLQEYRSQHNVYRFLRARM